MLESGNVALWKWFVPRSERCRGSHEVKEREGLPGRRNGIKNYPYVRI